MVFVKFRANRVFWVFVIQIFITPFAWSSPSDEVVQAQAVIDKLIHQTGIPGLSITVMVGPTETWSQGFGLADLENDIQVTPDTLMRVGSLSKSMTATALVKAGEQGTVDLDADIREYLPSFPQKKHVITLRQLGGHLGGVRHYKTDSEKYVFQHFDTVLSSLNLFQNDPLISVPGSEYHYSSYGYNLLSAVAEAAFEREFPEFLAYYLWQPLVMKHTVQDDVNLVIPGRARQYVKDNNGALINAPYTDNSYKFAGGGMLSTSRDLAKFGHALVNDSFLNSASRELLFSSQVTTDGRSTGYGLGWFVDMTKFLEDRKDRIPPELYGHLIDLFQDRQLIWHSGTSSGAVAMLLLVPETQVTVAITANLGGVGRQLIAATMEIEAIFSTAQQR
ncbi:MAG: hypothetical protein COB54_09415 [Alphaproteobacteria bacterium]|nr:MAG: hypothetical protein COB54_09415 [Alphaproteobacteria bacterium]